MPLERVVLAVQSANMQDAAVVGDFATTKLSVDSVSAAVLEQYDGDAQRLFYKVAMGARHTEVPFSRQDRLYPLLSLCSRAAPA